jgi:two-component system chemotaxis response regulator CheB
MPGFAEWLGGQVRRKVVLAREGSRAEPGVVYLAPDERHLTLAQERIVLRGGPPESGHRPSADALFRSLAEDQGAAGLGVLLTGMGEDGAQGLLVLRQSGGHTIAEHESTAVVYGMPGVAARIGGVCELVPLPEIAGRIRARCRRGEGA